MEKAEILMMNGGVLHTNLFLIQMMVSIVVQIHNKVFLVLQLGPEVWLGQW